MNYEKKPSDNQKRKICLIDNYPRGFPTDRISRFESILQKKSVDIDISVIHFTEFDEKCVENSAGIILSGSSFNVSEFYYNENLKNKFQPEIDFIRSKDQIPILGVCFGHQLIAYAFNGQVCRMGGFNLGGNIIFILLKKADELITTKNIPVNVHHLDFVSPNDSKIQENFDIISVSQKNGYRIIQYMRHLKRPLFSVQFHPETHDTYYFHSSLFDEEIVVKTKEIGENIIENFVKGCFNINNLK